MVKASKLTKPTKSATITIEDPCCVCGEESDVGCHGYRSGLIYDLYYCNQHYHQKVKPFKNVEEIEASEDDEDEPTLKVTTNVKDTVHRRPAPKSNKVRVKQDVSELVEYYHNLYAARLSRKPG